ncbi:hypothetical protein [Emcibacter sp.]|uniref:hypothetical protein n=1 Tax=Emcibacter sp. TaxID=1979954 RepID=UPI002AA74BE4|nr:hypothetical protein [Emcibacter sp.]
MKNYRLLGMVFVLLLAGAQQGQAADSKKPVVPCSHPVFRIFDFWVGEWLVYHRDSGKLAGYDRVSRTLAGCALQQSWISLDDHFSSPNVPFRMNGKSLTAFDGSRWVQFWVDNQAGSQILKGGPQDKSFVLSSDQPVGGYDYRMSWTPNKDGTIYNLSERRKQGSEEWETVFDFIYRRNLNREEFDDEDEDVPDS